MTFPRVTPVNPGDRITSANVAQLADALNARIRSGLGDAAFRIAFWWLSAFRQLRNPDASRNLWPANAEFFEAYQSLAADVDFPESDPGDPEGVNQASLFPWYVYGSSASGRYDESTRLTDPEQGGLDVRECATLGEAWALGKLQRGAIVPETGQMNAPAFHVARDVFSFVHGGITPHGKAYGGYIPTPQYLGDCDAPGGSEQAQQSFQIQFTNTKTNTVVTYPGTCPGVDGNVYQVIDYPLEYYVILNSGQVDWYPKSIWIQGPYTGGNKVAKTEGEHLPRIANRFAGEFRGDLDQIRAEYAGRADYLGRAFDVRQFLARPYYLAPARALTASADSLTPVYAHAEKTNAQAGDTIETHVASPSFWFCATYVQAPSGAVVAAYGPDGVEIARGTTNDDGEAILTYSAGVATVTLKLESGSGTVRCETAELLQYRPQTHDLFTVLRIAGARLSDPQGTDGCGLVEDAAADLWRAYESTGCIPKTRQDGDIQGPMATINRNAVFDAARRYSRVARLLRRQNIVGYAVENGVSILWVDPISSASTKVDALSGITDAIAHDAPPEGWSNEWVGFWQFKGYNPSESSLWKPDAYSDFFAMSDRCVYGATPTSVNADLKLHFNSVLPQYSDQFLAPEVAPGWRYATTGSGDPRKLNSTASAEFFKSCQVYPAPYEIDKAESVREDGRTLVKLTFKQRFQSSETAPEGIPRNVSLWDIDVLNTEREAYATDENALRDYLAHVADPSHQCNATGPGNSAYSNAFGSDQPLGTCYPHLWLVQLIPKPYLDGNDSQDPADTPITHGHFAAMETYIRVMCEGCVDGKTSADYTCATGIAAVYDYTFPTLCYQAFGRTSFGTLPTAATDYIDSTEIREDTPIGYGPLPTVRMAAEAFNQYASTVNLMSRYRLMLPMKFETQRRQDSGPLYSVDATYPDGTVTDCNAIGSNGFLSRFEARTHTPSTVLWTWTPVSVASGQLAAAFASNPTYSCASAFTPQFLAGTNAIEDDYRFQPLNPDALLAIPSAWRSVALDSSEMLCGVSMIRRKITITRDTSGTECVSTHWQDGADQLVISVDETPVTLCETRPNSGTVIADPIGSAVILGAINGGMLCNQELYSEAVTTTAITPYETDAIIVSIPLTDPAPES